MIPRHVKELIADPTHFGHVGGVHSFIFICLFVDHNINFTVNLTVGLSEGKLWPFHPLWRLINTCNVLCSIELCLFFLTAG